MCNYIKAEKLPNPGKDRDIQAQEVIRTQKRHKQNRMYPHCNIAKSQNHRKEIILKTIREKCQFTNIGKLISTPSDH
jgi:hypothetical protein